MALIHLEEAKKLKIEGKRLGRAGISQRAIDLIEKFDGTYFGAIELIGRFHALSIAAKSDCYWHEKMARGYNLELYDIRQAQKPDEASCN